ncbi:MAG TPA: sialate O-acetylesterase [Lacunisphaera sp.]|nr:sialate O-acetylesterase [Lacunisphaera sp.]
MKNTLLSCLALLAGTSLEADLTCSPLFSDHMVLQRNLELPVWGSATPGEGVTVEFAGQTRTATADAGGQWRVTLDPLPASAEPRVLTIRAANTLTFTDVLVGEVWFCSGQSNMEKPLGPRSGQKPTDHYEEELTRADCPQLRLFQVPHYARAKEGDGTMQWFASTGDALMKSKFSAAAYYFGRELQRELGIPVGLIHSSFGGTRIEAWMPPEAFATDPALRDLPAQKYQAWVKGVQATELYQSMVAPFVPFAVRGFLWYQGEANCMNAEHLAYAAKMRALITYWRTAWNRSDAPFYFAQLAPFAYSRQKNWEKQLTPLALPALWEAQVAALDVPHSGIITTSDLAGNGRDIHPTNKRDVGRRFARLALADTYGRALGAHAPRLKSARHDGKASFIVEFEHGTGLRTADPLENPLYFEIAGEDRIFHPADATVVEGRIEVYSPPVGRPVAVRFAWDELAMPNLVNAAGLPALPFRTDDWPLVLELPKEPK